MHRAIGRISSTGLSTFGNSIRVAGRVTGARVFSDSSGSSGGGGGGGSGGGKDSWENVTGGSFGGTGSDDLGWDSVPTWSTGLTKDHFDGVAVGQRATPASAAGAGGEGSSSRSSDVSSLQDIDDEIKKMEAENRASRGYVDEWDKRFEETCMLLKQVAEPGIRGSYLKDSEKAEMYRLHKENPEVYTVERLAKDYRIMRQRVHAILWLKEDEEKMEKQGHHLDDSVELLLDTCPEFFTSHDREFHVASLPYKPDFKVMPEGWDGTTRDQDEVHYEISKKEDDMLYEEFVQRFNFNKMKMEGKVKCHKYSRRRPAEGWDFTVEKLGPQGKRGDGGGWKFVSKPDGSSRPLNETEKIYLKREKPRRRRRWWWQEVGKQGA